MTGWTVEQTGGGCTADVTRVTDERTGAVFALVVTDGNLTAWTQRTLDWPCAACSVGVYPEGSWWGADDSRDATGEAWDDTDSPDLCAMITLALSDAGVSMDDTDPHGHSETVHALAVALLDARVTP